MKIDDQVPKSEVYTANGTTKEFAYLFDAPVTANLRVEEDGEVTTTGYTVIPASEGGGIVKFDTAPTAGTKIFIYRVTPISLDMDLNDGASFHADVVNSAFSKLTMIAQELRGGTVSTVPFVESAGHAATADAAGTAATADFATVAGSLSAGVVVDSATKADVAVALSAGVVANSATYATSATYAETASGLTNAAKTDVVNSAVQIAGAEEYQGPFAVNTDGTGDGMTAGMMSGYVKVGGSQYLVSTFDSDHVSFREGDTLYLTLLSSGGAITSGLVTSPSGSPPDTVVVRIAHHGAGDNVTQYQFGDITTVPWGGVTGIGATVENGSATVTLTGGTGAVTLIGAGNTSIMPGTGGGVIISGGGGGGNGIPAPDWRNVSSGVTIGGSTVTEIEPTNSSVVVPSDGWIYAFAEFTHIVKYVAEASAHVIVNGGTFKVVSFTSPIDGDDSESSRVGAGITLPVKSGAVISFSVSTTSGGDSDPNAFAVNAGCVLYT